MTAKSAFECLQKTTLMYWNQFNCNTCYCRCVDSWRVIEVIMMTSSDGNIFRVTGPLCGEFTGPGKFPTQRPVTRSFDVFFDLRLNKRLSKQPWGWWFETLSWSLWRHCNDIFQIAKISSISLFDHFRSISNSPYDECVTALKSGI